MVVNLHVVGLWLILLTGFLWNFCTEQGEFLSSRTGIPDGPDVISITKAHKCSYHLHTLQGQPDRILPYYCLTHNDVQH